MTNLNIYNGYKTGYKETYIVQKYGYNNTTKVSRDYIQCSKETPTPNGSYIQLNSSILNNIENAETYVAYLLIELCGSVLGYSKVTPNHPKFNLMKNLIICDETFEKFGADKQKALDIFGALNEMFFNGKFTFTVDPFDNKALIFYIKEIGWKVGTGCKEFETHHLPGKGLVKLTRRQHNLEHFKTTFMAH